MYKNSINYYVLPQIRQYTPITAFCFTHVAFLALLAIYFSEVKQRCKRPKF